VTALATTSCASAPRAYPVVTPDDWCMHWLCSSPTLLPMASVPVASPMCHSMPPRDVFLAQLLAVAWPPKGEVCAVR